MYKYLHSSALCFKRISIDWKTGDNFGFSLSFENSQLLVGPVGRDDKGNNSGAAYLYQREGGGFSFVEKFLPSISQTDLNFGYDVDFDVDKLIIGAPGLDSDSGYAEHFDYNGGCWTLTGKLKSTKANSNDLFEFTVGIGTEVIAIGSEGLNANIYVK